METLLMARLAKCVVGVGLLVGGLAGCGGAGGPSATAEIPTLRIAAASDLQTVMPKLISAFEATRKVKVEATFGASGQFAQQIRQGAPFDVYLAANRKFVVDLLGDGFIKPDSLADYAVGSLALAVHPDSADKIKTLDDLADPSIKKIALANPELAPYGMAGKQVLENAKLWDKVKPKIVQSETVRQALQFVETGNAEAGLVGKAIVDPKKVRVVNVDPALHDAILQGMGVVSASKHPEEAAAFSKFLLGPDGQKILEDAGFALPPTPSP